MTDQEVFLDNMNTMSINDSITTAYSEGFASTIIYEGIEKRLQIGKPLLITIEDEKIKALIENNSDNLTAAILKSEVTCHTDFNGARTISVQKLISWMLYGDHPPKMEDTPIRIPKAAWNYWRFIFELDSGNKRAKHWRESAPTWEEIEEDFKYQ